MKKKKLWLRELKTSRLNVIALIHCPDVPDRPLSIDVLTQQICSGTSASLKSYEQFRIQSDPTSAGRVHLQTRAALSRPAPEMELNTNAVAFIT